jgi:uncharacterized membrane protein YphA (DoxX/SURF4 family)
MKRVIHLEPSLLICRLVLAFSWIYQGVVPKIVCKSPGEIQLLQPFIPVYQVACTYVNVIGIGEILFGLLLLVVRKSWVFLFNVAVLVVLLAYVALIEPVMLTLPFNPFTLNIALIGLSLIAFLELEKQQKAPDA